MGDRFNARGRISPPVVPLGHCQREEIGGWCVSQISTPESSQSVNFGPFLRGVFAFFATFRSSYNLCPGFLSHSALVPVKMMMMVMIMVMMTMIVIDASSWMSMGAKQEGNDQSAPKSEKSQTAQISAIHDTLHFVNH